MAWTTKKTDHRWKESNYYRAAYILAKLPSKYASFVPAASRSQSPPTSVPCGRPAGRPFRGWRAERKTTEMSHFTWRVARPSRSVKLTPLQVVCLRAPSVLTKRISGRLLLVFREASGLSRVFKCAAEGGKTHVKIYSAWARLEDKPVGRNLTNDF